jgi:hypothetical protein
MFTASELIPGQVYTVSSPFTDYDGIIHPVGETWRFKEKHFLPYEDGLTLIVQDQLREVWIRLQWRPETQSELIEKFSEFVKIVR